MTETALLTPGKTVAQCVSGWDHLELWAGNARAMTAWLTGGFGFRCSAYAGPETGLFDRVSYVLEQGDIRFVVTAGLGGSSEVTRFVQQHGDGVRHLAWRTDDVAAAAEAAGHAGASVVSGVTALEDAGGRVVTAAIATYGETRHLFVDRSDYRGVWGPGFSAVRLPGTLVAPAVGLEAIDHVVGNVEEGRLDQWVAFYESLGFSQMKHFDAEQISTPYSALRSTVVWNEGAVVMPINEPAAGLRKSQITEYLEAYSGPGVQHIALRAPGILHSVGALRDRGVRFLDMPSVYYTDARLRCSELDVAWDELERLGVEVDTDTGGYLLQIFTEMMSDRPTLFLEIIQREGATGFGAGNFKALFEAIEREQARRGNL